MDNDTYDMEHLLKDIGILGKESYSPPAFVSEDREEFPHKVDTYLLDRSLLPYHGVNMIRVISGLPGGDTRVYLGRSEGCGLMSEVPVNGTVKRSLVEMAVSYR